MAETVLTMWDFEPTDEELMEVFGGVVTRENYSRFFPTEQDHVTGIVRLLQVRGLDTEAKAYAKKIKDPELRKSLFYTDLVR